MKELPETEDGTAQWCKDVFVTKVSVCVYIYMYNLYPMRESWTNLRIHVVLIKNCPVFLDARIIV